MLPFPRYSVIVSCQAPPTSPLHGTDAMTLMARAAAAGGAAALRANGPDHVAAFRAATPLPIIGIHKRLRDQGVFITPSLADAAELVRAGAQLVAVDGTPRTRLDGSTFARQVERIHSELGVPVMADVDTREAGMAARAVGADLVATTLSGYTEASVPSAEPDLALVRELVAELDCPVVAEGRYRTAEDVAAAFAAGAYAVVVGGAITDPVSSTRWMVSAAERAQREAARPLGEPVRTFAAHDDAAPEQAATPERAGARDVVVVTDDPTSDLAILLRTRFGARVTSPSKVRRGDLAGVDAIAVLGDCRAAPLVLPAEARLEIDLRIRSGVRTYSEYCEGIAHVEMEQEPRSTRFDRLVATSATLAALDIAEGDLLDDQCGTRTVPRPRSLRTTEPPLLQYAVDVLAHNRTDVTEDLLADRSRHGLWFEQPNLLVGAFPLSNGGRARFAPVGAWAALSRFLGEWLTGRPAPDNLSRPAYTVAGGSDGPASTERIRNAVETSITWFSRADMLVADGRRGVREGLATEILPTGEQLRQNQLGVRCDCTGESAWAFYLHHRLTGDPRSLEVSHHLVNAFYDLFQVDDPGSPLDGMVRWSEGEWSICYQDDVARGLLPQLLMQLHAGAAPRLDDARRALDFLLSTTGTDGTRKPSTAAHDLSPDHIRDLRARPGACPSAHRNAFYAAALLLAGHLDDDARYVDAGVRCLATIMATYPDTQRVMSETSELCRLVFPLACLVQATGDPAHRAWLDRVTEDLQRLSHPSGGYLEWDTGYKARHSHQVGNECSLLVRNGDPIVDLLYSTNWLPMGFAHAYAVTGDRWFRTLWERVATFLVQAQLRSADPLLDGAWARAFDVDFGEVYGLPNDVGWGPWAIETGWTMAPIAAGLAMGLLADASPERGSQVTPDRRRRSTGDIATE